MNDLDIKKDENDFGFVDKELQYKIKSFLDGKPFRNKNWPKHEYVYIDNFLFLVNSNPSLETVAANLTFPQILQSMIESPKDWLEVEFIKISDNNLTGNEKVEDKIDILYDVVKGILNSGIESTNPEKLRDLKNRINNYM